MAPLTWVVTAGSRVDGELTVVDDDGNLTNVDSVTWRLLDRAGAAVAGQAGSGEWDVDGVYLIRPVIPAAATKGHTYAVEITVTPVTGGDPELLLIPILVGGPTL